VFKRCTQTGQQAATAADAVRASTTELSTLHSQHPATLEQVKSAAEAPVSSEVQAAVEAQAAAEAHAAAEAKATAESKAAADALEATALKLRQKILKEKQQGRKFKISVRTSSGSVSKPADAFVVLYGQSGVCPVMKLKESKEHPGKEFSKGATDTFSIRVKEKLGSITHIQVIAEFAGFTGSGVQWQLESVSCLEVPAEGSADLKTFSCDAVLDPISTHCYAPALTVKQQLEWDAAEGHKLNSHFFSKSWDLRYFSIRGYHLYVHQAVANVRPNYSSDFMARTSAVCLLCAGTLPSTRIASSTFASRQW
jgi:hypothetical protein